MSRASLPDNDKDRPPEVVGFVPLDDRLSQRQADRLHTWRVMKVVADQIRLNLSRDTWGPNRPLHYVPR